MNPQEQRIAIAEAVGWKINTGGFVATTYHWIDPNGSFTSENHIPNYLNDLNAMHEAEKVLTDKQREEYGLQWLPCVLHINGRHVRPMHEEFKLTHATAAQRAEAFLRTIGKWRES